MLPNLLQIFLQVARGAVDALEVLRGDPQHHALIGGVFVCDDGAVHFSGGNDEQIAGAKVVDLIFNIIRHAAVQKVIELQKIVRVKLHGAKIGVSIV